MYTPPAFVADDPAILAGIMRAARLPILVSAGPDGIEATHLPLTWQDQPVTGQDQPGPHGRLIGHLARGNPQWRSLRATGGAMAVFQAHDFYVSPNWYETKRESGKVVPTWNYEAVHAYGTVEIIEDSAALHDIVSALTDLHEAGQPRPWRVDEAPEAFIASQLKGIVGVVMVVERLVGKRKLSQNRNEADRRGVRAGLEAAGDRGSAALMRSVEPEADRSGQAPSPPRRE